MSPFLFFIIGIVSCVGLAILVGRFLGSTNERCHSSENEQGRLRLDDCETETCHELGSFDLLPSLVEAKDSLKRR